MTPGSEATTNRFSFRTVERAIVAAIVVMLAGLVVPGVRTWRFDLENRRARADLSSLRDAILRFMTDVGTPPARGRSGTDGELLRLLGPGLIPEGAYFCPDRHQGFFGDHLVANRPAGDDVPGYAGWRGPYLDAIPADPWGFAYVAVIYPLGREDGRDGLLVSAGRNGVMDANYASVRNVVPAGDDLVEIVSHAQGERGAPPR